MPRRILPSLVLVLLAASIAAAVNRLAAPADRNRVGGSAAIRIGGAAYPREAIDSDSFTVRIARPARRIASQYWSIDEFVYSVVPPERVVAVSESSTLESVSNVFPQVQRYRPAIAADPERVLRLDPDLLLVSNTSRADFCAVVRAAGVPIYRMFTSFTRLDQVPDGLRLIGYLTGEDEAAAAQIRDFQAAMERAGKRRPAGAPPPRIMGYGGGYGYGSETFFDDIVRAAGGINVAAKLKGYNSIDSEQIVRWDPEWVIAGAEKGQTRRTLVRLLADPAIALTQAARNGHVIVFEYQIFLPISPFSRFFVTALAEVLYG